MDKQYILVSSPFMQHKAQQIHHHLSRANRILIVPHQHPDADALGAATALYEYLQQTQRHAHIFCATPVHQKLNFLAHSQTVHTNPNLILNQLVDTVIVVDSGDLRYAGIAEHLDGHPATIINIDHHATNEQFGHINLVLPTASSTCEIVFHFFRYNGIKVSPSMATALLAGLLTDTGNFTNAATSATAMSVAGELVRAGGNAMLVNNAIINNKSVETLHLWGTVLSRLEKVPYGPDGALILIHTYVTQNDLREHSVGDAEGEGIANFLNTLENADVVLILKEMPDGTMKGSFRTTKDTVDVSALAKKLGGGGHKKAAGFSFTGTREEALLKILTLDK